MLNFTAIDFETANSYRGSPCSVGLVKVQEGQITAERHWFIRPPESADWFDSFNVAIHGITPEMVESAPRWNELLPHILDFIGSDVLVAHNAGFDIGVMRYACAVDNIEWPSVDFLCTLVMGRRAFSLPSYRLPFVVDACGATLAEHHNALADARAVASIVINMARAAEAHTLAELARQHQIVVGRMHAGVYRGSVAVSPGGSTRLTRPGVNSDADPNGYLYGRVVVFTGALMSMTRQVAWEAVAGAGGIPEPNTTKRTNILVLGEFNPASLRPGASFSGKARRAFDLQDKGQDIELMTEADFLQVLEGKDIHLLDPAQLAPAKQAPRGKEHRHEENDHHRELKRPPHPTEQCCSAQGCGERAMFKTRSRPTWCDWHITEILREGGLEPLEPFTNPNDYRLTRCLTCGCEAHYRLEYTIDQNNYRTPTCRACFWRAWAASDRASREAWVGPPLPVEPELVQLEARAGGFFYLHSLTDPILENDPHLVECATCGKRSAIRSSDLHFGCACKGRR